MQLNLQCVAEVRISAGMHITWCASRCLYRFFVISFLLQDFYHFFDELNNFANLKNGKYELESGTNCDRENAIVIFLLVNLEYENIKTDNATDDVKHFYRSRHHTKRH